LTNENHDQPYTGTVTDIITYTGGISMGGYEMLCELLKNKRGQKAILVLATPGGDPHAGFRIARALQHAYGEFSLLVPRYCKSAGTLIAIGASHLYLGNMSELGPLDIQVKKNDELVGRNSGLDIIAALEYLRDHSMRSFHQHCTELVSGAGLSTKAASDIAARLTIGMLEPIAGQIDPMRLAEMQRAMDIAYQYGQRLNAKSGNLRSQGLDLLVSGYPSHGFVIDRKEAKSIFVRVSQPDGLMRVFSDAMHAEMDQNTNSNTPTLKFQSYNVDFSGAQDDLSTHASPTNETSATSGQPDAELCKDEGAGQSSANGADPGAIVPTEQQNIEGCH
jgi:hypothetical protein